MLPSINFKKKFKKNGNNQDTPAQPDMVASITILVQEYSFGTINTINDSYSLQLIKFLKMYICQKYAAENT